MNLSNRVGSRFKTARLNVSSRVGNLSSVSAAASVVMPPCSGPLRRVVVFLVAISISCFVLYRSAESLHVVPGSSSSIISRIFPSLDSFKSLEIEEPKLEDVLRRAATRDGTVILTTLNEAWAAPGSVIDLFFESFGIGEGTSMLLNHLVIIALDAKAYSRCRELHKHCFSLETEGVDFSGEAYFMTRSYLKMMWRRIDFLRSVLEMGYNFVFTDADVMWFRNPFPRFYRSADFQIACDHYLGRSNDLQNRPNGGFSFVRSNNRTVLFYKYWYASRIRYAGYHDQDVLNFIKTEPFLSQIGLKIRFLNTAYFGGLCEPSKDLNLVRTMHANCCFGMDSKLHDLRIMLQDWRDFMALPLHLKQSSGFSWKVPQNCSLASLRRYDSMDEDESEPPGDSRE
ncbi:hypothetical protein EUTSA_v10004358mg [Eutrema salsugineum]|uniref:Nucleotide-diphospho-sugar transferase domain-containing protein n=2 Tax=Eutrema TaxID=98005 RepID=V4MNG0_EUTSA|nr:uncharacterized protein At4g15970 [Eutrema salsugineum]ACQ90601.1 putative Myb DNA binding protein [Eutrema halophilum]ESQ33101.1 hypothetical protein EUTSA_v10004358mg [Eutrema salsugineum]